MGSKQLFETAGALSNSAVPATVKKEVLAAAMTDANLTWACKGLLAAMLDKDRDVMMSDVVQQSQTDETEIEDILKDLQTFGYVREKITYVVNAPNEGVVRL